VHVRGKAAHSSTPEQGLSAIDGANEVLNRLKRLHWPDRHDRLGGRQAIVYKIRYEPLAPHTLPSDAFLTIDRRLLPGDDPEAAVDEVCAALGDFAPFEVTVAQGVTHLPALVDRGEPSVHAFLAAAQASGPALDTVHVGSAFDAGGLTSAGIPAVTFGAGAGIYPVGPDFVPIAQLKREAELLARFIRERLG
jgi:acetylornithine deacetylase/succinyl-diaminopimelate desuccinylase-like protein